MDYQSLYAKTVVELRKLARDMGVRLPAGAKKQLIVELLLEAEARPAGAGTVERAIEPASAADAPRKRGRPSKAELAARAAGKQTDREKEAVASRPEKPGPADAPTGSAPKPEAAGAAHADGKAAEKLESAPARAGDPSEADGAAQAKPEGDVRRAAEPAKPMSQESAPAAQAGDARSVGNAAQATGKGPARQDSAAQAPSSALEGSATADRAPAAAPAQEGVTRATGGGDAAGQPARRPYVHRDQAERQPRQGYSNRNGYAENRNDSRRSGGQTRQGAPRYVSGGTPLGREAVPHQRHGVGGEGLNRNRPVQRQEESRQRPVQEGYARPARPEAQEGFVARNAPKQELPENRQRPVQISQAPRESQRSTQVTQPARESQRSGQVPQASRESQRPSQVPQAGRDSQEPAQARASAQPAPAEAENRQRRENSSAEYRTSNPAVPELLASADCGEGAGVLEIQPDGYGFLRAENCQKGPNDVYISIAQIRRFNLRQGDYVEGRTRPQREGDRYSAILYITRVNGEEPEKAAVRPRFEDLVPIYPDERIRLERPDGGDMSLRLVDMLAPIGKGQRGMIVSPPKAGKTTLLKKIANAITEGYPEIKLIVMLIDERPEEVTDMKRSINGEVVYSTFDEAPENHVRVSEMVLERAQRLVEMGQDVVVLMDSITRLARAYNLVITPTGRSLSGGLDPGALFKPKRFFGAARNIENGGSLTVIATALVDTGSRMDDIIFEEFKGTGNMELHLDRKLSDKRVFPAIDMVRSGTRREELLLSETELDGEMLVRRVLAGGKGQDMTEQIISLMGKTGTNAEFYEKMKGWIAVFEKEGYSLGGKQ